VRLFRPGRLTASDHSVLPIGREIGKSSDNAAYETPDRMTRSAVSRVFQRGRPWRVPRHRSH
jgi:hypothetical protein